MADYVIPDPEPKEIDEKLSIELRHLSDNAVLRGHPPGEEQCENCLYYLENTAEISYCWHPKLRILVGGRLVVPVVGEDPRVADPRSIPAMTLDAVPGGGVGDGERGATGDPGGGGARRPRARGRGRVEPGQGRDATPVSSRSSSRSGVLATDDVSVAFAGDVDAVVYTATADTRPDEAFADLVACLEVGRQRGVDVVLSAAPPGRARRRR